MRRNWSRSSFVAMAISCWSGALAAQTPVQLTNSAADASTDQLEDIVVTAQRRSQRLQDVPVAVTSLSSAALAQQGVTSTSDLSQAVPSLVFTSQLSAANPYIRGVGSQLFDPVSESPVAIYVDDVYIANPQGNVFSLAGVKQIDVLNGPQGTLFGRNATGGVIQIQTLDPTKDLHVDLAGGYGSYDTVSLSGYAAGGLSDPISTSLSALYENQGKGYGRNLASGAYVNQQARHNISLRNKWMIELPTTVIRFSADFSRLRNTNAYQRPQGGLTLLPGAKPPLGFPGEYNTNGSIEDFSRTKTGGVSLTIDQKIGSLSLTSISAYRKLNNGNALDQDQSTVVALDLTWRTKFHNFSQELRLQNSHSDAFNWIVGGYYYDALGAYVDLRADGFSFIDYDEQRSKSYAGFAQGTLTVLPNLNLTGGVRYTHDEQRYKFPTFALDQSQSSNKVTYRAAFDYHFTRDILGYVSYNTGFKSGGFNLLAPGDGFRPEELEALEAGLKTELFDHSLRFNIGGFFYRYKDQQVSVPSIGGDIVANVAGSRIKGLEASVEYRASSRLKINGGLSLMEGHYRNNGSSPPYLYQSYDLSGNPIGVPADVAGKTTVQTPDFVGNISAQYTLPTQVGDFIGTVGAQHNSGFYVTPDNLYTQPSYTVLNASLSWSSKDARFGARIWGKNLTDARYYLIQSSSRAPVGSTQIQAPPRTVGGTLSYHY